MLDLFILVIIGWSLYNGWRAGLVREILSTAGILVGLFGASLATPSLVKLSLSPREDK